MHKRIPAASSFTLNRHNIFIFPSLFGLLFFLLCICLFLLGTNYQNNLILSLCYFLLALLLINLFTSYRNFSRLKISLGKSQNVYAGDHIRCPLWLSRNPSSRIFAQGKLHFKFWQQDDEVAAEIDSRQNPIWLNLPAPRRGEIPLPRLTVACYYPLGLYRCWTHLLFNQSAIVYPKPVPCELNLDDSSDGTNADEGHSAALGQDDFDGLKSYQQGDPLYHVAWKQVAKGQGMISKAFSSSQASQGWLRLLPCAADDLEHRLGQLCFQVNLLSQQQVAFGLDLGRVQIPPASGHKQQQACLTALARFNWSKDA